MPKDILYIAPPRAMQFVLQEKQHKVKSVVPREITRTLKRPESFWVMPLIENRGGCPKCSRVYPIVLESVPYEWRKAWMDWAPFGATATTCACQGKVIE